MFGLTNSDPSAVHPALLNSLYLNACSIITSSLGPSSPNPCILACERHFLNQTQHHLQQSLAFVDRLKDFLWGSFFLSAYFARASRIVECFATLSSCVRFAVACGLHRAPQEGSILGDGAGLRLRALPDEQASGGVGRVPELLPAAPDAAECADRSLLWNAMYLADRAFTRASGHPSSIPKEVCT